MTNDSDDTPTVERLARRHSAAAVEALAAVMIDPEAGPAARVSAARALLEYGHGRPPQASFADGESGPTVFTIRIGNDD